VVDEPAITVEPHAEANAHTMLVSPGLRKPLLFGDGFIDRPLCRRGRAT
jgi:hypothetical protein